MNRSPRKAIGTLLVVLIFLSPTLSSFRPGPASPEPQGAQSMPGTQVVLIAEDVDTFFFVPAPPQFTQGLHIQSATITVNYLTTGACESWDPAAQVAFQYAVDIWASLVTSSVPIEIDACWEPLDPGVLGSAGATVLYRDFSGAPASGTWYPVALANALYGSDLNGGTAEINASFNSSYSSWYFGTDGNTPSGKYDLVSVVLHEVGHGLGFSGSMTVLAGQGFWGYGTAYPSIYDRFTENGSSQSLISGFPNYSAALAAQLTSNNIFFDGPNANAANGGTPPKLYAPGSWQQGSSYSHLDDSTYDGTSNALMTHAIGSAESIHSPGSITLGMFTDMGWTVEEVAPDLSIAKQVVGGGDVDPGDPVTFTLSIQNTGVTTAAGVVVTDTLSSDIVSPDWDSSLAGTSVQGGVFVWDLPDLAADASGVITVTGMISPGLPANFAIVNIATISSDASDSDGSNNSSTAIIGGYRIYLPLIFNDS